MQGQIHIAIFWQAVSSAMPDTYGCTVTEGAEYFTVVSVGVTQVRAWRGSAVPRYLFSS